jgi:hypothetical protein
MNAIMRRVTRHLSQHCFPFQRTCFVNTWRRFRPSRYPTTATSPRTVLSRGRTSEPSWTRGRAAAWTRSRCPPIQQRFPAIREPATSGSATGHSECVPERDLVWARPERQELRSVASAIRSLHQILSLFERLLQAQRIGPLRRGKLRQALHVSRDERARTGSDPGLGRFLRV